MKSTQHQHSTSTSKMHRLLTAAMLSCFALGGWFWSQESSPKHNQATAATTSKPTSRPAVTLATAADAQRISDATRSELSTPPRYVTKNIEDIREGDYVLAREEHGDKIALRRVVEAYRRTSYHLRHLTFESEDGSRQTLQTTDEHPFWHAGREEWLDAADFVLGDLVTTPDGHRQTLIATQRTEHPEGVPVFNFQVEHAHTYFVANSAENHPLLVHNANYMTPDQVALKELVAEATMGGRKALDAKTANILLDWADEVKYPDWRASIDDLATTGNHWVGGPHIHIPGTGARHLPVLPGVTPR